MNYTKNGFKSIIKKSKRKFKKFEEGNYKEQMIAVHKRWADVEYWKAHWTNARSPCNYYQNYLKGIDMYTIQ